MVVAAKTIGIRRAGPWAPDAFPGGYTPLSCLPCPAGNRRFNPVDQLLHQVIWILPHNMVVLLGIKVNRIDVSVAAGPRERAAGGCQRYRDAHPGVLCRSATPRRRSRSQPAPRCRTARSRPSCSEAAIGDCWPGYRRRRRRDRLLWALDRHRHRQALGRGLRDCVDPALKQCHALASLRRTCPFAYRHRRTFLRRHREPLMLIA